MNMHVPTLQRSLSDVVAEYDLKKAVENFHTIAARKLRYQLKLETENADQDS